MHRPPTLAIVFTLAAAAAMTGCRPTRDATSLDEAVRGRAPAVTPARTVDALVTGAANGPRLTPSVSATPPPATATTSVDLSPDDDGYIVNPGSHDLLRHPSGYLPLDAGPAGSFLVDLQAHLTAHDVAWLVDAIDAGPIAEPSTPGAPALTLRALDGDKTPAEVTSADIAAALAGLVEAGSRPIVQGYFASLGADPVALEEQVPDEGARVDTLDVVVTGWQGDTGVFANAQAAAPASVSKAAPATAVWRFTRDLPADEDAKNDTLDTPWRWRAWRWSHVGGYPATVAALEQILDDADKGRYTRYHAVRPRDRWPTPVAEETRDVPSPDGRWIAREVDGGEAQIDARDERSSLHFRAVRIVDAAGAVVAQPLAVWQMEDMGFARPAVFSWRPGHDQVVVGWSGTGDGCDLHGGAELFLCDAPSGALTPLAVTGNHAAFDPSGARLASVGVMGDGMDADGNYRYKGVVRVLDVDAGTVLSATFAAQEIDNRITWSPDGSALVATAVDDYAVCAQFNASHLVRFAIQAGQLTATALTTSAPGLRRATAWRGDGTLDVDVFDAGWVAWDTKASRTERRDAATGALVRP